MDKGLFDRWVEKKLITAKQKAALIEDYESYRKEKTGNRFVIFLASIGALLLGIAALVWVSANWQELSSIAKVLIMFAVTAIAFVAGEYFREKDFLPHVGTALIFLSCLLWGASLFVIAQSFQLGVDTHWLLLIWLLVIAPVGYIKRIFSIQCLSVVLFLVYLGYLLAAGPLAEKALVGMYVFIPFILYALGAWHYRWGFEKLGRTMRLVGIVWILLELFIAAFFIFPNSSSISQTMQTYFAEEMEFIISSVITGAIALVMLGVSWLFNPTDSEQPVWEYATALVFGLIFWLATIFLVYGFFWRIVSHLMMISLVFLLFKQGLAREDMRLINIGTWWLAIYVIALYIDLFYQLLDFSLFLFLGGAILLGGGVFLERSRRKLKERIA